MILKGLESGEAGTSGNQFMTKAGVIGLVVGVDLVVGVLALSCSECY